MLNYLYNFDTEKMEQWQNALPSENADPLDATAYLPHGKAREVYRGLYALGHNPTSAFLAVIEVCDQVAGDTPVSAYADLTAELDAIFQPILDALYAQVVERQRLWGQLWTP